MRFAGEVARVLTAAGGARLSRTADGARRKPRWLVGEGTVRARPDFCGAIVCRDRPRRVEIDVNILPKVEPTSAQKHGQQPAKYGGEDGNWA